MSGDHRRGGGDRLCSIMGADVANLVSTFSRLRFRLYASVSDTKETGTFCNSLLSVSLLWKKFHINESRIGCQAKPRDASSHLTTILHDESSTILSLKALVR